METATTRKPESTAKPDGYRILQALGPQQSATMAELVVLTGLSSIEIAKAMFQLKQLGQVNVQQVTNGRGGDNHSVYCLTDAGRAAVPPAYVRDVSKYNPEATSGYKHVHGMAGKVDYSKPLRGLVAVLYNALSRPGMDAHEISEAANIELRPTFNGLTRLLKLGIVTYTDKSNAQGRARRCYTRAMEMRTDDDPETVTEPAKPILTPAAPGDKIIESIVQKNTAPIVSSFSKPNPSLDDAVDELLQRHSLPEVMLALLVRLDGQWRDLTEFRDRILKHAKGGKP